MLLQNQFTKLIPLLLLSTMTVDCSENKFKGGAGTASPASVDAGPVVENVEDPPVDAPGPVETPAQVVPVEEPCDKAGLLKSSFPENISSCFASNKVWKFDTEECVEMRGPKFTCDFKTVIEELRKIGLASPDVEKAAALSTTALMGCGQSADSQRIVVQWVNIPEGKSCKDITPGSTVTGCFTNYGTDTPPPAPIDKEERDKRTYACMVELDQ